MNTPLQISMQLGAVQAQSVHLLKEKEHCLNRSVLGEAQHGKTVLQLLGL